MTDMTQTGKMQMGSRRSAFIEGAVRLDRVARPGEQNGAVPILLTEPPSRMAAVSPDEAWSKRFMSMGIGPQKAAPIPPLTATKPATKAEPVAAARPKAVRPEKPQPIGAYIGKPVRRSLLRRLFRKS